jgi:UDP-N-acetylglucosamine 4,6-dehydratase/5-epimerase
MTKEINCLLVTGGTGSFGHAITRRALANGCKEIRIFSRDEKKQDDMRKSFSDSRIKFYIGDVRDYDSVLDAVRGVEYVFHAAALKQVPSCEFYPMEAVKTNVLGTSNLIDAAIASGVKQVVCLSTDKAVYPINAMGISKALMEKVAAAKSRNANSTTICTTRYGNVMASRGSVIPLFLDQLKKGVPLTLTDPEMTRFMMTLEDAVELVLFAFDNATSGDIFVQKAPAATVGDVAKAMLSLTNKDDHQIDIIGTRHGEKLFETLLSREEHVKAEDLGDYYRVPLDHRDLNYNKFTDMGENKITEASDYNSHNTRRLKIDQVREMLSALPIIKQDMLTNS